MNRLPLLVPNGTPAVTGPVCGTCRHFFGQGHPPIEGTTQPDLSKTVGQCRGAPPWPLFVGMGPQGPLVGLAIFPNVLDSSPPCGLYAEVNHDG